MIRNKVLIRPRRSVRPLTILKSEPWRPLKRPLSKPEINRRRAVSYLLIFTGTVLCTYVAGTYAWMYVRQHELLHQWEANDPAIARNFAKLSIPRIHLEDVVLEGATKKALLLGPAHLAGTSELGTSGNAVIAGHRDTFFRNIHQLKRGDDIYILRGGRRFHYIVTARRIVEPADLSVLKATSDDELTLITCYPTHAIGPAPERLVIVAKLISDR
jgi:LPXTG-site transpeptidase (sortase) family protein